MSVRFLCSSCNTSIKAKDEYSGKTVRCPHCRERTLVPSDDQPNDILELGDDYGLAAMSVGDIEIDSPEMHIEKPSSRPNTAPLSNTLHMTQHGSPDPRPPLVAVESLGHYPLLLRASLGFRVLAALAGIVWLYILGGEFIELIFGSKDTQQASQALLSPTLQFAMTFLVGASTVCFLAGASEALRVLLDIRNSLARTQRK